MRIIIYGAGGVGCVIGGHLAHVGHDVLLIGRPGHVNKINENGLRLVTPGGVHELKIPAVTHPDQIKFHQDDAVFLCMKPGQPSFPSSALEQTDTNRHASSSLSQEE